MLGATRQLNCRPSDIFSIDRRAKTTATSSLDLARPIAMESEALFPGTAAMIAPDVAAGRLVRLDFRIPVMTTAYGFAYLRDRTLAPAARAFMDAMRTVEAELAAAEGEAPRTAQRSRAPQARRVSSNRPPPARPRA